MGTWGPGIFEDDLAEDIRIRFEDLVESGVPPARAADEVREEFEEVTEDPDEGPVLILALATLLLDRGIRNHPLLGKAREVIQSGAGLDCWREAGEEALAERLAVYRQLAERLAPSER